MNKNLWKIWVFSALMLQASSTFTAAQWSWINPLPTGNDLKGVYFVTENTGWIVGSKGTIYKTSDGGTSWIEQDAGVHCDLNDVIMLDENSGYIAGDSSVVLKTINGGINWERLDLQTPYYVKMSSVFFIDDLKGWVGGDYRIYRTSDGGQTWSVHEFWWADWVDDIQFLDSLTGYRAGRFIEKTLDGGESWDMLSVPVVSNYTDVYFLNPDTGWVCGENLLIRTTDGGESWTSLQSEYYAVQIVFTSFTTGFRLGPGYIAKTTNGGLNWSNYLTPNCSRISVAGTKAYSVGEYGSIVRLDDLSGNSWVRLDKNISGHGEIQDIFFNDPDLGFAATDSGKILRTTNGGNDWECFKVPTEYSLHKVFFTDAYNGWTISDYGIYSTSDGGVSWNPSYLSNDYFRDIEFIDSHNGWALSWSEPALQTKDKGQTWEHSDNYGTSGNSIDFPSINKGWIVGSDGKAKKTINAGLSWSDVSLPVSDNLNDVKFFNESIGWINGNNGIVLKTTNGGTNWIIQSVPAFNYDEISLIGQNKVWITGTSAFQGGTMIYTQDGSAWLQSEPGCNQRLNTVYFTDENHGFAAGIGGAILKYVGNYGIPDYPKALLASGINESSVQLSWQDRSDNEVGFEILRSDEVSGNYRLISTTDPDVTSYIDTELNLGTVYWYRVRALNSSGLSAWTREDSASTLGMRSPGKTELTSPVNFSSEHPVKMEFSWSPADRATTYRIQIDNNYDFSSPIFDSSGIEATFIILGDLENDTYYNWRVCASNGGGTGQWSEEWYFSTLNAGLDIPQITYPVEYESGISLEFLLTWTAVSGALSYWVQVDEDFGFSNPVFECDGITGTSCMVEGLSMDKWYYVRIRAANELGTGSWSMGRMFGTISSEDLKPEIPVLLLPADLSSDQPIPVTFYWRTASKADYYELQVDEDFNFASPVFIGQNLSDTFALFNELQLNTFYFWRVRSINDYGSSDWSLSYNFVTEHDIPAQVFLTGPLNGTVDQPLNVMLLWLELFNCTYDIEVDDNSDFSSPFFFYENSLVTWIVINGLDPNTIYYWHVRAKNSAGTGDWSETYWFATTFPEGLSEDEKSKTMLYPNPFSSNVLISYFVPERSYVIIEILNMDGKNYAILEKEIKTPGRYSVFWQGKEENGNEVPPGFYIVRIQHANITEYLRLIYLK